MLFKFTLVLLIYFIIFIMWFSCRFELKLHAKFMHHDNENYADGADTTTEEVEQHEKRNTWKQWLRNTYLVMVKSCGLLNVKTRHCMQHKKTVCCMQATWDPTKSRGFMLCHLRTCSEPLLNRDVLDCSDKRWGKNWKETWWSDHKGSDD